MKFGPIESELNRARKGRVRDGEAQSRLEDHTFLRSRGGGECFASFKSFNLSALSLASLCKSQVRPAQSESGGEERSLRKLSIVQCLANFKGSPNFLRLVIDLSGSEYSHKQTKLLGNSDFSAPLRLETFAS